MTIFGIEGGIGTGKTLSGVHLMLLDMFAGKKIFTNAKLKLGGKLSKYRKMVTYLTADEIHSIFEKVKKKEMHMENSTVFLQEAHNYVDSRNSASKKNKVFSYWILQSRHTGKGSCDIIYDTQELGQVDIRLRRNTDFVIRPYIIERELKGKPKRILMVFTGKIGHSIKTFTKTFDVSDTLPLYDTHQIVDF